MRRPLPPRVCSQEQQQQQQQKDGPLATQIECALPQLSHSRREKKKSQNFLSLRNTKSDMRRRLGVSWRERERRMYYERCRATPDVATVVSKLVRSGRDDQPDRTPNLMPNLGRA